MEWLKPVGIIGNANSWNSVIKRTYQAERAGPDGSRYLPMPPADGVTQYTRFLVGAQAPNARPRWTLGAYFSLNIFLNPDSSTEFTGLTEIGRWAVPLNQFRFIVAPDFGRPNYAWRLFFPARHPELYVECWGLDEELTSDVQQSLAQINAKLDAFPPP